MKINKNFLLHNTGGETVLVPSGNAGFSGVVRGNRTLGAILELLKTETSEPEIVETLSRSFPGAEEQIRKDVERALAGLRQIGALDE